MTYQANLFDVINPPQKTEKDVKQPSLKMINFSKGKAGEYSSVSLSMYSGCGHGCNWGCYMVSRASPEKKVKFHSGAMPRYSNTKVAGNPLIHLENDLKKLKDAGYKIDTNILMSFGTDPYNPKDEEHKLTREAIILIKEYGFSFTILTKGGSRALRDIDLYRLGGVDMFASSLTFIDPQLSKQREPNAALPEDRIATIRKFYNKGIKTWVSLEPIIDPKQTIELIYQTHTFVDEYKIGKWNYNQKAKEIDWQKAINDILNELKGTRCNYFVKESLRKYLGSTPHVYLAEWNRFGEKSKNGWLHFP